MERFKKMICFGFVVGDADFVPQREREKKKGENGKEWN